MVFTDEDLIPNPGMEQNMNIPQINSTNTPKAQSPEMLSDPEAFRKFDEQFNVVQQELNLFSNGESQVVKDKTHREQVEANRKESAEILTEESQTATHNFLMHGIETKSRQASNIVREGLQQRADGKMNLERNRVQTNILDEKLSVDKARYQTPTVQPEETSATTTNSFGEIMAKESNESLKNKLNMLAEANENMESGKTTKTEPIKAVKPSEILQNQNLEKTTANNNLRTDVKAQDNSKISAQMTAAATAGKAKPEATIQSTKSTTGETVQNVKETSEFRGTQKTGTTAKMDRVDQAQRFEAANIKEVVGNIRLMFNTNQNEMVMRLNPEHLGKLEIKLKKDGDTMTASMKVENLEAKSLIESQIMQLRENLQEQGVFVSEFNILLNKDVATQPSTKIAAEDMKQNKSEGSGTGYASTDQGANSTSQSGIRPIAASNAAVNFYA